MLTQILKKINGSRLWNSYLLADSLLCSAELPEYAVLSWTGAEKYGQHVPVSLEIDLTRYYTIEKSPSSRAHTMWEYSENNINPGQGCQKATISILMCILHNQRCFYSAAIRFSTNTTLFIPLSAH